jgi:hypothetical protein
LDISLLSAHVIPWRPVRSLVTAVLPLGFIAESFSQFSYSRILETV